MIITRVAYNHDQTSHAYQFYAFRFLFLKSMEGFYFLMKEYSVPCTCLGMKLGGYSFYNHVQNHLLYL